MSASHATPTAARKPSRRLRVLSAAARRGEDMLVEIAEKKGSKTAFTLYWLRVVPSDWGFATRWEKIGKGGEVYHANQGGDGPRVCDCKGCQYTGSCRHLLAIDTLLAKNRI